LVRNLLDNDSKDVDIENVNKKKIKVKMNYLHLIYLKITKGRREEENQR
jgi:hypothetical protein